MIDSDFIKEFLSGNPKIFSKIYTESYDSVERYILSRGGSKSDAEDVFQNALMLLYARLKENDLEIKSTFNGYLFTICKNLWRRNLEKNKVTNIDIITLVNEDEDRAMAYVEQQQWEIYIEKFQELSENCQQILSLYFNKVSYAELVKKFNYKSEVIVRQRVYKCKLKLIKLIKKAIQK